MSDSTLKCEFCNKQVSNAYILKNHQKNTKACLEIQEKLKKNEKKVSEPVVEKVEEKVSESVVEKVNDSLSKNVVEQSISEQKVVNVVEVKLQDTDVDQLKLYYNMFITLKNCYEEQINVLKNTNCILQKQVDEANIKVKEMDNKTAEFISKSSSFNKQIVNLTYDHIDKFCKKDDKISLLEEEIDKLKKENASYAESLKYFYKKYDDAPPVKSSSNNSASSNFNLNKSVTDSNSYSSSSKPFGSNTKPFNSNKSYTNNIYNTSNNVIPELKITNEFGEPLDQDSISFNTKQFVESMQRMAEQVKKAVQNSNSSYEIGPDGSHVYTINNYYNDDEFNDNDDNDDIDDYN
jgi:hypothetical protein